MNRKFVKKSKPSFSKPKSLVKRIENLEEKVDDIEDGIELKYQSLQSVGQLDANGLIFPLNRVPNLIEAGPVNPHVGRVGNQIDMTSLQCRWVLQKGADASATHMRQILFYWNSRVTPTVNDVLLDLDDVGTAQIANFLSGYNYYNTHVKKYLKILYDSHFVSMQGVNEFVSASTNLDQATMYPTRSGHFKVKLSRKATWLDEDRTSSDPVDSNALWMLVINNTGSGTSDEYKDDYQMSTRLYFKDA